MERRKRDIIENVAQVLGQSFLGEMEDLKQDDPDWKKMINIAHTRINGDGKTNR